MASSFSTDLKLELMVTGENSGTWGDKTNTNLNLLQQAIAGYQSIALTSTNTTLVMTDATISDARNAVIEFTGTLAANATVFVASGIEKTYTIKNSTTGAYTLALNQVGGSSVIWGTAEKNIKGVYLNGTNANTIDLSTLGGAISTSASIGDFVVGPNELDTASVTEVKIASSAVTSTKIASFAVTSGALDTASVTSVKIAAAAVGPTQLANTAVTAGSYTATSLTVDAQGRITAASSGSAGGGGFVPTQWYTSSTGTYTANPAATAIACLIFGGPGGGGGGTMNSGATGGSGGQGGYGYFNKAIVAPYSQPYSIGNSGNGGGPGSNNASGGAGNAGNATNLTNVATGNAGNGGSGGSRNGGMSSAGNNGTAPAANFTPPVRTYLISNSYGNGGSGGNGGMCNPINAGTTGTAGAIVIWENIGK
jgi:hypothetical protein